MGLLESSYRLIFKADTDQARAEIKLLSGEEKKAAEARLFQINEVNRAVESQAKKFEDLKTVTLGVLGAVKTGLELVEFAGKRADLASAAAGVSMEQLRAATFGTRTETELLTTAAKLNHSVFQISQEDMNTAAKAMTALAERGGNAQEAIDAVTEALVTGKTKGLKQYGIAVDETKDKSEKYRDIMQQLTKVSGEVSDASFDASDKVGMMKVSFVDAVDKFKEGIGKLATALGPLLALLGKAVGLVGDIAGHMLISESLQNAQDQQNNHVSSSGAMAGASALGRDILLRQQIAAIKDHYGEIQMDAQNGRKERKGGSKEWFDDKELKGLEDDLIRRLEQDQKFRAGMSGFGLAARGDASRVGAGLGNVLGGIGDAAEGTVGFDQRNAAAYGQYRAGKESKFLEGAFGKIQDFDLYKKAFDSLTGAVGASMGAWIDGSMSAGQAFKKFIGEAVKSLAVQMSIEALKHGAYALGSLAFGDFAGAAKHGIAAAEFAAGAAAAAIGAKELGAGAKSTASGGGSRPSAPSVGGSGSGAAAPSTPIIVYADSFADDSPRGRQLQADKLVNRVRNMNTAVQHS